MADSTLSALPELKSIDGAEELYINNGGVSNKLLTKNLTGGIYFVTDTSIADHGNAAFIGSIAYQVLQAKIAGGGTVYVAPGTYTITNATPITLGVKVSLIGAGKGLTFLDQNHATAHGLVVDSGTDFVTPYSTIKNLTVQMPTGGTSGDGISLPIRRAAYTTFEGVEVTGGSTTNWGISNHGNNLVNMSDIWLDVQGNGMRILAASGTVNYGDAFIHGLEITLRTASTTGLYLLGAASSSLNNFHFARTEVKATGGVSGCIGIHLDNYLSRTTFIQTDIENCGVTTGESILISNTNVLDVMFMHTHHIGTGTVITDNSYVGRVTFLGGDDDFKPLETYQANNLPIIDFTVDTVLNYKQHAGKMLTNSGATGKVILTLPAADSNNAWTFMFSNIAGQILEVAFDAGDRLNTPTAFQTTTPLTSTGTVGEFLKVVNSNYKHWNAEQVIGTWT